MKRLYLALVLLAVIGSGVLALPAPVAQAAPPTREYLGNTPLVFPGGAFCSFDVQYTPTKDNEYVTTFTDANGQVTMSNLTGVLKATLTNLKTGYSLDLNISGPAKTTYNSDGSGQEALTGASFLWGLPYLGMSNMPWLAYTDGPLTVQFDSQGNITGLGFVGHVTDLCAALDH